MTVRLYLVRHGEVDPTWHDRVYGCLDVPLSERGEREAEDVARLVASNAPSAVVCSGLARTRFGARAIARALDLDVHEDAELREIERGRWVGRTVGELDAGAVDGEPEAFARWYRSPATRRPPGGENLTDLAARVLPRLDHWASSAATSGDATRDRPDGGVAIVAHLWVVRVSICHALDLSLDTATRINVPTGSLVVIDWPRASEKATSAVRPTLVGFGVDSVPGTSGWFRGPGAPSPPGTPSGPGR